MRCAHHAVALCALWTLAQGTFTEAQAAGPVPHYLLIVSIDGLAWDGFANHSAAMPTLKAMARTGASGPLASVFPSMTWAAHASLSTGQLPARHGILGNRYYDRAAGRWVEYAESGAEALRSPSIADAAHGAGWSVASLFWPNTGGSKSITWNLPEAYRERDFRVMASPRGRDLVRQVGVDSTSLSRLAGNESYTMDRATQEMAVTLVAEHKPRLIMVHLLSVDTAAHAYGPESAPVRWAMESADRNLLAILQAYDRAGIGQSLVTFVVSDHGFLPVDAGVAVPAILKTARKDTGNARLQMMANGHALYVYGLRAGGDAQSTAAVLRKNPSIERVYLPAEFGLLGLAALPREPRSPDLIALARPSTLLWNGRDTQRDGAMAMLGAHGYLPTHASLAGVFVARGPGIAVTRVNGARAIDVAPTAAAVLALPWSGSRDGTTLRAVLATGGPQRPDSVPERSAPSGGKHKDKP